MELSPSQGPPPLPIRNPIPDIGGGPTLTQSPVGLSGGVTQRRKSSPSRMPNNDLPTPPSPPKKMYVRRIAKLFMRHE